MSLSLERSFWGRMRRAKSGCLEWSGAKLRGGYGRVYVGDDRRLVSTHRLAWELTNGREVPDGLWVCHRCDNPSCCEPTHLFVGSSADNHADMAAKGRSTKGRRMPTSMPGERNPQSRLTAKKVLAIRRAYANAEGSYTDLAKRFGIAFQHVGSIVTRTCWRHLKDDTK